MYSLKEITDLIESYYNLYPTKERVIRLRTGTGGFDMFGEAMERSQGLKRIYSSKQLPRIFKIKLRKSVATGRYYRLIKM